MLREKKSEFIAMIEGLAAFLQDITFPCEYSEFARYPGVTSLLAFTLQDEGTFTSRDEHFCFRLVLIKNEKCGLPWIQVHIYR